jgi:hypothetical protein
MVVGLNTGFSLVGRKKPKVINLSTEENRT